MPVPSSIRDLSTVPGSNSPPGSEAVGTSLDDYLRTIQSFIRNFWAIGADVAAAATLDLNAFDTEAVRVTGTATITSLGTCPAGFLREVRFAGVCTLTHSASLLLPGGVNITTAANDVCTFRSLGSGNWILVGRVSGNAAPIATGTNNNRAAVWSTANGRWEQATDVEDSRGNLRDIPLNTQNAAYTFALTDRGCAVMKTNTTAYTWTIPLESSVAFPNSTAITIVNDGSAGNITVNPTGGVTLIDGVNTGAFTLVANNARTLLKVGTNRWRVV
jgi:hypothetical protein